MATFHNILTSLSVINHPTILCYKLQSATLTALLSGQYTLLAKLGWVAALVSRNTHN